MPPRPPADAQSRPSSQVQAARAAQNATHKSLNASDAASSAVPVRDGTAGAQQAAASLAGAANVSSTQVRLAPRTCTSSPTLHRTCETCTAQAWRWRAQDMQAPVEHEQSAGLPSASPIAVFTSGDEGCTFCRPPSQVARRPGLPGWACNVRACLLQVLPLAVNKQQAPKVPGRQAYHVVASVNGNVYTEWQAIVCYHWWRKARAMDTQGVMGGFTRLLHRCRRLLLRRLPCSPVPDRAMQPVLHGRLRFVPRCADLACTSRGCMHGRGVHPVWQHPTAVARPSLSSSCCGLPTWTHTSCLRPHWASGQADSRLGS